MIEKLIIKQFANINNIEITINKINILIGSQASGKSICAKLLFYFKTFVREIVDAVDNGKLKRELDSALIKKFEEYFPRESWGNGNFTIRYEIANKFIEISKTAEKPKLSLTYSEFYKIELSALRSSLNKIRKEAAASEPKGLTVAPESVLLRYYWSARLAESLHKVASFSQLFIPASRSSLAFLEKTIFSFLSTNKHLDPFFTNFASVYENAKRTYRLRRLEGKDKERQEQIERLINKILCGNYLSEKGKDFIVTDGRRVSLAHSSSGQQETLPLAIILYSIATGGSSRTVYVEEPEAHLFPTAQRDVVELIATVFNVRPTELQFFITTHSPYILTAINNLLQAGIIYSDAEDEVIEKLNKIIPKYQSLLTNDLAAYSIENGKCKDILCKETGLIDASIIDAVSDELAIEFDQLLNLA